MRVESIKAETLMYGVLAVAGLYLLYKAVGKVDDVAEAVNPFNNDNIFNQAATSFYQTLTGSTGSIGGDIYDFTHDTVNPTTGQVIKAPATKANNVVKGATYVTNPALGLFSLGVKAAGVEYEWLKKKVTDIF